MESNQRETAKIVTPFSKDEIVVYTYITGEDNRKLSQIYLNENSSNKAKIYSDSQDAAFRMIIVSVNGKKEGEAIGESGARFEVVPYLLSLRKADFQFVVEKINEIIADKEFEDEKKDSPVTSAA